MATESGPATTLPARTCIYCGHRCTWRDIQPMRWLGTCRYCSDLPALDPNRCKPPTMRDELREALPRRDAYSTGIGPPSEARDRAIRAILTARDAPPDAMTTPLPLPNDPALTSLVESWPAAWVGVGLSWPRSKWLATFAAILREHYPTASSRRLSLTARGAAPFLKRDGPNVP